MDGLAKIFLVGGGGFLGANLRYWLGQWTSAKVASDFPWATMFINISGSFAIGLLLGLAGMLNWNPNWRLLGAVGILGGYTTYSSFAYDSVMLISEGRYWVALAYIQGTALLTVIGAWLGLSLAHLIVGKA